jgi:mono/diheme cytochrome c family protein
MGKFVAGIVVGIVGLAVGAYVYVHYGYINMRADQPVMAVEKIYLGGAMDRYAARYAPKVTNPLPASDATLIAGARIYKSNCAGCHGGPEQSETEVGKGLFPQAPQFMHDAPDMPQEQNFWIIKHGIARTGMPAWDKVLSDNDIWKVVTLLSKFQEFDRLSPAVQQEWKTGGQPVSGGQQNPSAPGQQAAPAEPHPGPHDHHAHD